MRRQLWPLGAPASDRRASVTLRTRLRDKLVRVVTDRLRGWRHGQWAALPGCYRLLPSGKSFVFIHINKTGGTSIARALGANYRTHLSALEARRRIPDRMWRDAFKFALVRNPWDKVVSHYEYRILTNQTGLGEHPIPFIEWVKRAYGEQDTIYYDNPKMFQPQVDWIAGENGTSIVDFVGRFEEIQDTFEEVRRQLEVDCELPHLNRSELRDYREYFDDESKAIIADCFAGDCRDFGYEF